MKVGAHRNELILVALVGVAVFGRVLTFQGEWSDWTIEIPGLARNEGRDPALIRSEYLATGFHCPEGSQVEEVPMKAGTIEFACLKVGRREGPSVRVQRSPAGKPYVAFAGNYRSDRRFGMYAVWNAEGREVDQGSYVSRVWFMKYRPGDHLNPHIEP